LFYLHLGALIDSNISSVVQTGRYVKVAAHVDEEKKHEQKYRQHQCGFYKLHPTLTKKFSIPTDLHVPPYLKNRTSFSDSIGSPILIQFSS
jgi:hypothetical protein